ncbi:MAG: phosphatidylglycerophosphatase A [Candidatus Omnitrophica bacterium]|nr:phosphatidylglycerophosphatase A [Candidatus Omnitrophota bacterium]
MNSALAKFIATFGYIGLCPVAPGTAASAAGVVLAYLLRDQAALYIGVFLVVTVLGFLSAGIVEKDLGKKDPGCVVIDEVSGMMISLFMLPLSWPVMLTGFFLFRAFDMFKIYPANKLEDLGGSTGIMCDDIAAGIYANLTLQVALRLAGWM